MKQGDHVKLKGRIPEGIVEKITSNHWVQVAWAKNKNGPKYVHEFELDEVKNGNG